MKKFIKKLFIFAIVFLFIIANPTIILGEGSQDDNGQLHLSCFGRAAHFDGVDDSLEVEAPNFISFSSRSTTPYFTIEAWIRPISPDKYIDAEVIARDNFNGDSALEFGINNSKLFAKIYTISGVRFIGLAEVAGRSLILANTKWYHVALVRRGKFIQLYLDGEADSAPVEIKDSTFSTMPPGGSLVIGGQLLSGTFGPIVWKNFEGYIDEVRISSMSRYTINFNPPTSPYQPDPQTLSLWHMDEAPDADMAMDSALVTSVINDRNNAVVRGTDRMFEDSTISCNGQPALGNIIPRITTFRIPQAQKKHPLYNFKFTATDANIKDKLTMTLGDLADNFTLTCPKTNPPGRIDCTLNGMPQEVGTFYFTITVKDDKGGSSSKNFALRVNP